MWGWGDCSPSKNASVQTRASEFKSPAPISVCNPSFGRWRQVDPRSSLTSQPDQNCVLQVQRSVSKTEVEYTIQDGIQRPVLTSTWEHEDTDTLYTHVCVCACVYIQSFHIAHIYVYENLEHTSRKQRFGGWVDLEAIFHPPFHETNLLAQPLCFTPTAQVPPALAGNSTVLWFPALTVSIKELLCLSASKDKWPPSPPLQKLSELQFNAETHVSCAAAFKDCGKIVTVLTHLQATSVQF